MSDKYFLAVDLDDEEPLWQEVTKDQYVRAERSAGFHSKFGRDEPATAGFSAGGVRGRIEYQCFTAEGTTNGGSDLLS